jgi:hypothetical protein
MNGISHGIKRLHASGKKKAHVGKINQKTYMRLTTIIP